MSRKKKDWSKPKEAYGLCIYLEYLLILEQFTKLVQQIDYLKQECLKLLVNCLKVLGYVPRIQLLRQRQTKDNYKVEALVLKQTVHAQCTLGMCEWVGESELRKMDEQTLLNTYDRAIAEDFAPTIKFEVSL